MSFALVLLENATLLSAVVVRAGSAGMPKRLSVIVLACYATVCSSALSCTRLLFVFVFVFGLSISACLRGSRGTGSPTFADPTRQEVARHGHRHGRAQARHRHRHGRAQAPSLPLPPGPKALRCCLLLSFALMVLECLRDCVCRCCCPLLVLSVGAAAHGRSSSVCACCPCSLALVMLVLAHVVVLEWLRDCLPSLLRAARAYRCCCCSCSVLLRPLPVRVVASGAAARARRC